MLKKAFATIGLLTLALGFVIPNATVNAYKADGTCKITIDGNKHIISDEVDNPAEATGKCKGFVFGWYSPSQRLFSVIGGTDGYVENGDVIDVSDSGYLYKLQVTVIPEKGVKPAPLPKPDVDEPQPDKSPVKPDVIKPVKPKPDKDKTQGDNGSQNTDKGSENDKKPNKKKVKIKNKEIEETKIKIDSNDKRIVNNQDKKDKKKNKRKSSEDKNNDIILDKNKSGNDIKGGVENEKDKERMNVDKADNNVANEKKGNSREKTINEKEPNIWALFVVLAILVIGGGSYYLYRKQQNKEK